MAAGAPVASMLHMAQASALTRRALVEVGAASSASPKDPIVRRYRLARVPIYTRSAPAPQHFAHARRSPR